MTDRFAATLLALTLCLASTAALAAGSHGSHANQAIGEPGQAAQATRTVQITMNDQMRFVPDTLQVGHNETVRLVLQNVGKLPHELVLGTQKELREHNEAMKKNPGMEHADENMLTLAPGASGTIVWRFTKPGTVHFACLQPGHYEMGMKGKVRVGKAARTQHAH